MEARTVPQTAVASDAYLARRARLAEYFDRTAAGAWALLTSNAPVSGVRRTVREGRDRMRATLAWWLPHDLHGVRVLDAGCGTGAMAVELAARGADVTAIDLSPTLVGLARERAAGGRPSGRITWRVGDMLDPALGTFDHVVLMDALIHYPLFEMTSALAALGARTTTSIVTTFAPATPLLRAMHVVGRRFPRADRAPAIEPVAEPALRRALVDRLADAGWQAARSRRISTGFYTSQALELRRHAPTAAGGFAS